MAFSFDFGFITRPKCNGEGAANQIDQKQTGTVGTTGTINTGAGLRVPSALNPSGDKWGQTGGKPQNGQAAQQVASTGAVAKTANGAGDSGNLSPVSPVPKTQAGTKKPSVYAGVPSVPVVPTEKTPNPNANAKTPTRRDSLTPAVSYADPFDPPPVSPKAEWVAQLATAYHLHHFACKQCQSAGRSLDLEHMRCETGGKLWKDYQDAS